MYSSTIAFRVENLLKKIQMLTKASLTFGQFSPD